ncbi:MAG: acetyl-CoA synthase subunit gamma [Candidatus Eisenbacteria bacterium]|uniref:Acetyl-CoA synthase subunit gamma n=1 Tax=Eiseniibacteriota bacterium TaxID=2212470 RepID=A0A937X656_UNCEI|nr:acetyl-CoA synthase subunit gamma [Candidatus Eisenbacteria bacterium]
MSTRASDRQASRGTSARAACGGGGRSAAPWIAGVLDTPRGPVPRVRTRLGARDRLGAAAARWAIGRMRYRVPAGLYAVGAPGSGAPVLVSANYKMSFDHLRRALEGRDAWILVLDTRGINVWCAAGKGTFGTDELVSRVGRSGLAAIVAHRLLVVPQLGAPGLSAHLVLRRCGFRVLFGPVRARDLPAYLDAGMRATEAMRRVRFGLADRIALIPVEIATGARPFLAGAAALMLLAGFGRGGYSLARVVDTGLPAAGLFLGVFLASAILGPMLLPWLPGRAFSLKGAALGLLLLPPLAAAAATRAPLLEPRLQAAAWALLVPAIASFTVMNFTGATTYTSLSGVLSEMRIAVPAQAAAALIGLVLWMAGLFAAAGG